MKRLLWIAAALLVACSSTAASTPRVDYHVKAKATPKPIAFTVLVRRLATICDAIPGGRYMLNTVAMEPANTGPYFICEGQGEKYVNIDITPEMLKP